MSYKKNCPQCLEDYKAGRIDQVFCSTKCRNAYNNNIQSKLNGPYRRIANNLKTQDELLSNYSVDPGALFHSAHFHKNRIYIDHAFRLNYDNSKNLMSVEFVKFKLVNIGNSLFKIVKI